MSSARATPSRLPWDGFTAAEWTDFVEAETRSALARDPEWIRCEVARCFSPEVNDPSRGFLYFATRHWNLTDLHQRRVLFRPRRLQALYLRDRDRENVILKARKRGASTVVDALYYWRARSRPYQNVFVMAHDLNGTDKLWQRILFAHDRLPPYLRGETRWSSRRELKWKDNDSHFEVLTAGGRNAGRGGDADGIHLSEFAFYPRPAEVTAAIEEAARPGAYLDIESSPNGFNAFRDVYVRARGGNVAGRRAHFYPWFVDSIGELEEAEADDRRLDGYEIDPRSLTEDERRLVEREGLSLAHVAWRRDRKERRGRRFDSEHPEDDKTCFLYQSDPEFNVALLAALLQVVEENVENEAAGGSGPFPAGDGTDNGRWDLWVPPVLGHDDPGTCSCHGTGPHRYVVGADVAEGVPDGAWSVAGVLDVSTDPPEQVAEWRGKIHPVAFGREILTKIGEFYNDALLAPERNNHGHATIAGLVEAGYWNLYEHVRPSQLRGGRTSVVGWPTDPATKPVMIGQLRECLDNGLMIVRSSVLVREALAFQRGDEDRDDDVDGLGGLATKDAVMAWAIAWQVRARGSYAVA